MGTFIEIFMMIISVVLFRVSLVKFCDFVDYKKKLLCVAGMMLGYTGILVEMIYLMGHELVNMFSTVKEFSIYTVVLIVGFNFIIGGTTIIFCTAAKRRTLSSREKIMLKDL